MGSTSEIGETTSTFQGQSESGAANTQWAPLTLLSFAESGLGAVESLKLWKRA